MSTFARFASAPGLLSLKSDSTADPGRISWGGGSQSLAGEFVTPSRAPQLTAVLSAVKILAETVAMLPLDMYERDGDSMHAVPKHPLQFILHDEPNPDMSAMDWRMAMMWSLCLHGNAYAKKAQLRTKRQLAGLWPLMPELVSVQRSRATGQREYVYYPPNGGRETYAPDQILHVRTMAPNGLDGISPITYCRNAVGLAMALERYGSRYFANGAMPGVILEYPGRLGDEAQRNLRESWKKLYGGADNAYEVAIAEEGLKVNAIGIDPQKSQSIESRKFQILEIARIYRIPPHMLGAMETATFGSIEQMSLEFVIYTLMPWLVMWEQAISRSLLDSQEKGNIVAAFNVNELLRGDMASRYNAYAIGRQWGWLSVNDILKKEGMNGIGPAGDVRLEPLNMIEVGPNGTTVPQGAVPARPGAAGTSTPGGPSNTAPGGPRAPKKGIVSPDEYLPGGLRRVGWEEAA